MCPRGEALSALAQGPLRVAGETLRSAYIVLRGLGRWHCAAEAVSKPPERRAEPVTGHLKFGAAVTHAVKVLVLTGGLPLSGSALAQACLGYVSVDGLVLEHQAACYFGPAEGASNAYVRTDKLTSALDLASEYDPDTGVLRFRKGERMVEIRATSDIDAATRVEADTLSISGRRTSSLSAVLTEFSYVPIAPLVAAFGGTTAWNAAASMVVVDLSDDPVGVFPTVPAAGMGETAPQLSSYNPLTTNELGPTLAAPRYGLHDDYTRVAVNLPEGLAYRVAVDGNNLIVLFPDARAAPFQLTPESKHLAQLSYATVGDALALIVRTRYPLHRSGSGFRAGTLPSSDGRGTTLYLDFAPGLRGKAVQSLPDLSETEPAAVKHPAEVSRAVVIDVGHGGEDPGAISDYAVEKELVLSVGLKLKTLLERRGIKVVMTREGDHLVRLEDRAAFAVPSEHNLFISLHANATERGDVEGIETWVFGEPQDDSVIELAVLENGGGDLGRARTARSQELAARIDSDLLREENLNLSIKLAETIQHELVAGTGGYDRGVRKNYFAVIHDARIPAVLVEMGFVNHPVEGPRLATDVYQTALAKALDVGISGFLEQAGALTGKSEVVAAGGTP